MNTNGNSRFAAETHVAAPLGKQTVRGVIVSTKAGSNDFGHTYRMTVKVTTTAGAYLVNTTIPTKLFDECQEKLECLEGGWIVVLRGCEVQFNATLEASDSAHFAFGKRPTKATLVSFSAEKTRQPKPWDAAEIAREEAATEAMFAAFEPAA